MKLENIYNWSRKWTMTCPPGTVLLTHFGVISWGGEVSPLDLKHSPVLNGPTATTPLPWPKTSFVHNITLPVFYTPGFTDPTHFDWQEQSLRAFDQKPILHTLSEDSCSKLMIIWEGTLPNLIIRQSSDSNPQLATNRSHPSPLKDTFSWIP